MAIWREQVNDDSPNRWPPVVIHADHEAWSLPRDVLTRVLASEMASHGRELLVVEHLTEHTWLGDEAADLRLHWKPLTAEADAEPLLN